jgi:hypothetical protein
MDELKRRSSRSAIREISSDGAASLLLRPPCSAEMGMYCWRDGAYARIQGLTNATIHDELLASDMIKPLK